MKKEYFVGIDIGGTTTKFGVVTPAGEIIIQDRIPSNDHEDIAHFIQQLANKLNPMMEKVGGPKNIRGIGIGAPNGNFNTGTIEYAPNLRWEGIIPLTKLISEKFNLPSKLTNDANAAAMGEKLYGCTKQINHFITITLGTGVGSGIVIDGNIVVGHDGFAGELGHTIIRPGGRLHPKTGLRGSLEAYASASGVCQTAIELLESSPERKSLLRDIPKDELTSEIIFTCAEKGDEMAKEVYEFTGQILGESIANFVLFSSPEVIVLFGGVTKAGDMLLNPIRKHMEANLLPIFQNKIKIMLSQLNESDAAILGASALVS
jgi:glucokinase